MATYGPDFEFQFRPEPASFGRAFFRSAQLLSEIVERDVPGEFAQQMGNLIRERTRTDMRSAEGRSGQAFNPYSPTYAAAKGVSRTAVDITLSGQLLDSITGRQEGNELVIFFAGQHREATAFATPGRLISSGGMSNETLARIIQEEQRRPFFGFTDEEVDFVAIQMQRIVDRTTVPNIEAELQGA